MPRQSAPVESPGPGRPHERLCGWALTGWGQGNTGVSTKHVWGISVPQQPWTHRTVTREENGAHESSSTTNRWGLGAPGVGVGRGQGCAALRIRPGKRDSEPHQAAQPGPSPRGQGFPPPQFCPPPGRECIYSPETWARHWERRSRGTAGRGQPGTDTCPAETPPSTLLRNPAPSQIALFACAASVGCLCAWADGGTLPPLATAANVGVCARPALPPAHTCSEHAHPSPLRLPWELPNVL